MFRYWLHVKYKPYCYIKKNTVDIADSITFGGAFFLVNIKKVIDL